MCQWRACGCSGEAGNVEAIFDAERYTILNSSESIFLFKDGPRVRGHVLGGGEKVSGPHESYEKGNDGSEKTTHKGREP